MKDAKWAVNFIRKHGMGALCECGKEDEPCLGCQAVNVLEETTRAESPPVPDDVAEAVKRAQDAMDYCRVELRNDKRKKIGYADLTYADLETLIRAAECSDAEAAQRYLRQIESTELENQVLRRAASTPSAQTPTDLKSMIDKITPDNLHPVEVLKSKIETLEAGDVWAEKDMKRLQGEVKALREKNNQLFNASCAETALLRGQVKELREIVEAIRDTATGDSVTISAIKEAARGYLNQPHTGGK